MKTRTGEAQHLEADYLTRLRQQLANLPEEEINEIILNVQQHIEEALSELDDEPVTLAHMAQVIETLGPPDSYSESISVTQISEAVPAPPPSPFSIGTFFNEALEMYRQNFLVLVLGALISHALMIVSLLILAGPIFGGYMFMCIKACRKPDHKAELGDLFAGFKQFWPLLGLFFLTTVCELIGMALLIIPGLLLFTIWFYCFELMVDRKLGVFESMRQSKAMVMENGFGLHFVLTCLILAMDFGASFVPYVGEALSLFMTPLTCMICVSAYLHICDRSPENLAPLSASD